MTVLTIMRDPLKAHLARVAGTTMSPEWSRCSLILNPDMPFP
jgi:hypothetical protein